MLRYAGKWGSLMGKKEEEQASALVRLMSGILLGGALALLVCLAVLLICSVGISGGWIGEGNMTQVTLAGCVLGSFVGGLLAVSRSRTRRLLVGLGAGCVFFLLLLLIGVLFYPDVSVDGRGLGLLCASLVGGALAGLLGGRGKKKRRK
jgi:putative membrane protein (TIGR04086 family)